VEEIIDSGAAIKAVVGVAELLIFPSTILPEQYHGKYRIGHLLYYFCIAFIHYMRHAILPSQHA
jgi:hypothetical protein